MEGTEWYVTFLAAAVEYGLIEGMPDGTFHPLDNITRAEACTIVNRTLGRAPHEAHLLPRGEMLTWPDNNTSAWYYAAMQEATNSHDYIWTEGEDTEEWTGRLTERDWAALERVWSVAHDAPGRAVKDSHLRKHAVNPEHLLPSETKMGRRGHSSSPAHSGLWRHGFGTPSLSPLHIHFSH